ncbi:hypothetical protein B0H13DRAFT_2240390 [Mycena leptocephala]|nr:hypothetical protein B0H13DRAFT_2240390 [Mycena leptocephala]
METTRGVARGSYIWGRSVNNTRIERLWYDVTHGFGYKWKSFFLDLEVNHDLNPSIVEHIWLLHLLFLHCINDDAQEWADAWNGPMLGTRTTCISGASARRFTDPPEESIEDPTTYGIDWDVVDNPALMRHHLVENPQEWENHNPFAPSIQDLSEVPCEPPNCPFSAEQIASLDSRLANAVDIHSRSMHVRKLVWIEAFRLCNEFYE